MKLELALLAVSLIGGLALPPGLAGQCFVYPWLGLFPGLAAVAWWLPGESRAVRFALALALAPLITTVAAWALVSAGLGFGTAAWTIAIAGALGTAGAALRPRAEVAAMGEPVPRSALAWAGGLALVVLVVPALNPYLFVRGDAWIHGGIVAELLTRGFPPEDARMAGVRLNYVWFFNFYIALLTSLRNQDLFRFMALFNAGTAFSTVVLVAMLARRVWASPRVAVAAAVLLTLGLNAGAFLLWPLHLLRAVRGSVQGGDEVARLFRGIEWGTGRIIYSLSAPFSEMVSFLDKPLVGTALNYAYLQMTLLLWALVVWLGGGRRHTLVIAALASAGMMLFHSVVGLSVLPVTGAVLAAAWAVRARWPWLPEHGRLGAALVAMAAGGAVTLPYLRSITAGWSPENAGFRHRFLEFQPSIVWTILTACFFGLWWGVPALRAAWRERRAVPVLLGAWALAMAAFACFVSLPQRNTMKFVYQIHTALVLLAAPRALEHFQQLRRRPAAGAALALLFLLPAGITLHGYLVDPTGRTREELHPVAGEEELYRWLRDGTPRDAVIVDRNFRDLIAVRAARRLYLGTDQPPELAAFPAAEMRRRRRVMLDLYGTLGEADSSVARLRALGRPVYVVYRPNDPPATSEPWRRLVDRDAGEVVYESGGFHVVRIGKGDVRS